jgi:excinuclease ABC subunit A
MSMMSGHIEIKGASEHNLKDVDLTIPRGKITVITGVSGSGKSSLAFDTVLAEAQRRFFYTLSHYTRQFLDVSARPAVKKITGLSPAIALAQNETSPSRRATIGSLSDVSELLGVLFARFGQTHCPEHGHPTQKLEPADITMRISEVHAGATLAICAPLADNKKGNFRTQMKQMAERGFARIWIDGEVRSLLPTPELNKETKHSIKLIVDYVKVTDANLQRLQRSVDSALKESEGFIEVFLVKNKTDLDLETEQRFSTSGGCPECGYAWPKLDTRYFSANSLGKCEDCDGYGNRSWKSKSEHQDEDVEAAEVLDEAAKVCDSCHGTGLKSELKSIQMAGKNVLDVQTSRIDDIQTWMTKVSANALKNPAMKRVSVQASDQLRRLQDVGLGYVTLSRRARTLSGGEAQRLKLAGVLGDHLRGVLYVLDEPSQGLHPSELADLCKVLTQLRDGGNTLIVVDHDEMLMRHADYIVDLGPGGGTDGGHLMAKFEPKDAAQFAKHSATARSLSQAHRLQLNTGGKPSSSPSIEIKRPTLNNLKPESIVIHRHQFNVVCGVSGSGKTSLVCGVLYENLVRKLQSKRASKWRFCEEIVGIEDLERIALVDRKPVAKSSVSMPATYLEVFTHIRDLFASLPEAQVAGCTARSFSLHVDDGRCEECKGRGEIVMSMRFLPDARVTCDVCKGKRFRRHVLDIQYNGYNISEVLNMTLKEAAEAFKNISQIKRRLEPALQLGLGYLKMGQPTVSLSGGEAQRLKLAPLFGQRHGEKSLVIVDEPTTGLHFSDVEKLLVSLRMLVAQGATVVLIEHNLDVIAQADWLVELGPGSADAGGKLVYSGVPAKILTNKQSKTAQAFQSFGLL